MRNKTAGPVACPPAVFSVQFLPPLPNQLTSSSHCLGILFPPFSTQLILNPLDGSGYSTSSPIFLCMGCSWSWAVPSSPKPQVPLLGAASFCRFPENGRILELSGPLVANILSRVFLSCNCLTVPPPQGRDCPLSSCVLYTVFYTVKGIPQGGTEPPWLGALSLFTEWMDAWPLGSAIHILCHTPVVCTVCLSFVFLIYGMCQICLSLDRVEV